jgi:hypothetical protein
MVETESVSIRQICPETVILSHFSCQLTNVQRFTISAHYIKGAARGSRLCIRSASPARYVTKIMTRVGVSTPRCSQFATLSKSSIKVDFQ